MELPAILNAAAERRAELSHGARGTPATPSTREAAEAAALQRIVEIGEEAASTGVLAQETGKDGEPVFAWPAPEAPAPFLPQDAMPRRRRGTESP